jgi:hypothetical protein
MCGQAGDAASCKQACVAAAGTSICKNQNAIVDVLDDCLAKDCDGYRTCLKTLPACEGGTRADAGMDAGTGGMMGAGGSGGAGTGGSGAGTGGSGGAGTGGSGGATGCEACVKFESCCAAALGPSAPPMTCAWAMTCNALMGAGREQVAEICRMSTAMFAAQPDPPAACK